MTRAGSRGARRSATGAAAAALAAVAATLGLDLLVLAISGKVAVFALFALVPVAAWRYARARLPAHAWLVTGAAFGAVVVLVGRGLGTLLFVDGAYGLLLVPVGLLGAVSDTIHGTAGYGLARWLGVAAGADLNDQDFVFRVAPVGGALWAIVIVYGCLGAWVDRARNGGREPPHGAKRVRPWRTT